MIANMPWNTMNTLCGIVSAKGPGSDVLRTHHAAVKQRKPRRHQQHQRGRDENPGRIAGVDLAGSLGHGRRRQRGKKSAGRRAAHEIAESFHFQSPSVRGVTLDCQPAEKRPHDRCPALAPSPAPVTDVTMSQQLQCQSESRKYAGFVGIAATRAAQSSGNASFVSITLLTCRASQCPATDEAGVLR
jgi:hypothetical protein